MVTLLPTTGQALDHLLATRQATDRVPSLVAGLWRGTQMLWTGARGGTGTDGSGVAVQYRIGSISKTFTAVAILRLRDEGAVALSDRLDRFVGDTSYGDRTLLDLLSHGGGVAAETPLPPWWERSAGRPWATLAADSAGGATVHPPGRRFHYSNLGTASLGRVLEVVRGATWWDVVRTELGEPLGLSRTTYDPQAPAAQGYSVHPHADLVLAEPHPDTGAMAPAGQLWSTVADLARWGQFLSGAAGRDDVLDGATLQEMRHPVHVNDGDAWELAYGLGLQVWRSDGRRRLGHGGSMPGFVAGLAVDEADGSGCATLANTTAMAHVDIDDDLLGLLHKLEPAMPDVWVPSPVPAAALEIVGPWYRGPRPLFLSALADGGLQLGDPAGDDTPRFEASPDGTWRGLEGYYAGETLRVVRAADGTVRQLDLGTFCLTRKAYDPAADNPGGLDPAGWHVPDGS